MCHANASSSPAAFSAIRNRLYISLWPSGSPVTGCPNTRHALRWADDPKGPAVLSVIASSGDKAHGHPHPTLYVAGELWAWSDREPSLLGAFMTALLKVPECKFLGISTAASSLDSPLGKMRARALAQPDVERTGPVLAPN